MGRIKLWVGLTFILYGVWSALPLFLSFAQCHHHLSFSFQVLSLKWPLLLPPATPCFPPSASKKYDTCFLPSAFEKSSAASHQPCLFLMSLNSILAGNFMIPIRARRLLTKKMIRPRWQPWRQSSSSDGGSKKDLKVNKIGGSSGNREGEEDAHGVGGQRDSSEGGSIDESWFWPLLAFGSDAGFNQQASTALVEGDGFAAEEEGVDGGDGGIGGELEVMGVSKRQKSKVERGRIHWVGQGLPKGDGVLAGIVGVARKKGARQG
ncbi:hypothetical protein NL676_031886 [Syzygium grande]|nr:hypothetical protein NL676_031886 [Syzygium grande]